MKLAGLDIETLDTSVRSQVFEVAIVRATLDEEFNVVETGGTKFRFEFLEQMALQRTVSTSTIEFHERLRTPDGLRKSLYGESEYIDVDARTGLDIITKEVAASDELWINGLSFDCSILLTMAMDIGYEKPLWKFRRERDVRTIRETNVHVHQATDLSSVAHKAYEDALWNLQVAAAYYKWMASLPKSFTT